MPTDKGAAPADNEGPLAGSGPVPAGGGNAPITPPLPAGQGTPEDLDPAGASARHGEYTSMSLFSSNTGLPQQSLSITTIATYGTPAPAPLVHQPSNPIEAVVGGAAALINIATTAISTLLSSILTPGPTTPAPPVMLFVVTAWVQRELQRTFFNQRPHAQVDAITTSEDSDVDITVLSNDTDADIAASVHGLPAGDVLTVTDYTQPANGSVVLNSNGTFTYTPNAGYHGTDTFSYTISDEASPWHLHGLGGFLGGGGHTSTTSVSITVEAVNDDPSAPTEIVDATDEDTPTNGNLLTGATDPDGDDLDVTLSSNSVGTYGNLTVNSETGAYTYTPQRHRQRPGPKRHRHR
ncbi:cadherin-like domain-containing protein [Mycolicibacterium novocastrense]|nr:cadherin-like domain-containing protein [Mycolicibacterium novocastrense]